MEEVERPFVSLQCHHCEFSHPGELGSLILVHESTVWEAKESPCPGSGKPSKCFCPGVMRTGCPCSQCCGRGWTIRMRPGTEDEVEMYCDCIAGIKRRAIESGAVQ